MKLNYKKTFLVGLAFMSISAFWQLYDNVIPLMLKDTFGVKETARGIIMALDNVLALFLLPFFGSLSDKSKSKFGKRIPFILLGTVLSFTFMIFIPYADNTVNFVLFLITLGGVLVSMGIYRSPAVALMTDVTPKVLRSSGNAVINLMGSAGGILVLILGMVFATSAVRNSLMSYVGYFSTIALIMIIALAIFLLTVREPKFVADMHKESERYGLLEDADPAEDHEHKKLGASERTSLLLILSSIVLWFMGYNAITSKYSVYASNILHKDYNFTLIIAQAAAIISYLPVGIIASKIGRKKTIIAGVIMLTAAFTAGIFMRADSPTLIMNCIFALAGIAWATINVNSFPMVVEMCSGGDVGKYTGYYYSASMAAQVVTPVFSGYLMDKLGMTSLFPYAAIFTGLAFFTMLFVRHGDSKPEAKHGLDALEDMDSD